MALGRGAGGGEATARARRQDGSPSHPTATAEHKHPIPSPHCDVQDDHTHTHTHFLCTLTPTGALKILPRPPPIRLAHAVPACVPRAVLPNDTCPSHSNHVAHTSLTSLASLTSLPPLSPPGPARPPADMPLGLKKTSSLSVMVRPGLRGGWVPSALHGTMATLHYACALRLGPARKTTATRNRKRESRKCTRPTQGAPAASSPALASHLQPPALAAPCHILEPGSNVHGCLPAACTCSPLHLHTLLLSSSLNAQLRNILCFIKSLLDASPGT
jgi:hypothetical protein